MAVKHSVALNSLPGPHCDKTTIGRKRDKVDVAHNGDHPCWQCSGAVLESTQGRTTACANMRVIGNGRVQQGVEHHRDPLCWQCREEAYASMCERAGGREQPGAAGRPSPALQKRRRASDGAAAAGKRPPCTARFWAPQSEHTHSVQNVIKHKHTRHEAMLHYGLPRAILKRVRNVHEDDIKPLLATTCVNIHTGTNRMRELSP
jgi:hypothetical protein